MIKILIFSIILIISYPLCFSQSIKNNGDEFDFITYEITKENKLASLNVPFDQLIIFKINDPKMLIDNAKIYLIDNYNYSLKLKSQPLFETLKDKNGYSDEHINHLKEIYNSNKSLEYENVPPTIEKFNKLIKKTLDNSAIKENQVKNRFYFKQIGGTIKLENSDFIIQYRTNLPNVENGGFEIINGYRVDNMYKFETFPLTYTKNYALRVSRKLNSLILNHLIEIYYYTCTGQSSKARSKFKKLKANLDSENLG